MKEDVIIFDAHVFSLETIKRALYRFSDKCSFDIQMEDNVITVTLQSEFKDDWTGRIKNEVLDQDLRDTLSQETANIRTLILANAFSNTGLIE
ncbi:MAG: His-Xaa-Ser system protein HxsD [Agitococcus sp.]|nr:His-Xaa-Ser system protein HxsD [Agitococcus sp.]